MRRLQWPSRRVIRQPTRRRDFHRCALAVVLVCIGPLSRCTHLSHTQCEDFDSVARISFVPSETRKDFTPGHGAAPGPAVWNALRHRAHGEACLGYGPAALCRYARYSLRNASSRKNPTEQRKQDSQSVLVPNPEFPVPSLFPRQSSPPKTPALPYKPADRLRGLSLEHGLNSPDRHPAHSPYGFPSKPGTDGGSVWLARLWRGALPTDRTP